MKQGRGMCGTFKVIHLTYHARTTFIDLVINVTGGIDFGGGVVL